MNMVLIGRAFKLPPLVVGRLVGRAHVTGIACAAGAVLLHISAANPAHSGQSNAVSIGNCR
jgi:hypothetical protein